MVNITIVTLHAEIMKQSFNVTAMAVPVSLNDNSHTLLKNEL